MTSFRMATGALVTLLAAACATRGAAPAPSSSAFPPGASASSQAAPSCSNMPTTGSPRYLYSNVGCACTPAEYACTPDHDAQLMCHGGSFSLYRYCRGPQGCASSATGAACDDSAAVVGEPCGIDGAQSCSADGLSALRCDGHAFVVGAACTPETKCTSSERHCGAHHPLPAGHL
jgi:hypothetical protein